MQRNAEEWIVVGKQLYCVSHRGSSGEVNLISMILRDVT